MCVGIPMTVQSVCDGYGLCIATLPGAPPREERVDMALLPEAGPGDQVLVFMGLARTRLEAGEAARIAAALGALAALSRPDGAQAVSDVVARGFADLCAGPPRLPPHLEAARAAGLEEA
ncbi:HypC/HybG/HupF family hydrogenase formation chaperone [Komagataeibacter melaceti]|uniref:HypC/HybG/HupF family hydrogenase formation chaperone n=1 Tax=Komagataeibacter melaceti TaxID=2766577 RepID=A0A371Z4E3_9PROT|nr:HypC/HybG/HupF family hydrogenase formation chaperone [Komagataeibacter melaceti]RFD21356.1 HypC/HybG/HupF family hydrogenase formation chaperone [Komagataeibacter melaceti]